VATVDRFDLDKIDELSPIQAEWFLPFLIHRLKPVSSERTAVAEIFLQNVAGHGQSTRFLELRWGQNNDALTVPPVQESVITEWAACGFSCMVLSLYARMQHLQVTLAGDGFDFWVGNDSREFGLEISGTHSGDLALRHRSKIRQLLRNEN